MEDQSLTDCKDSKEDEKDSPMPHEVVVEGKILDFKNNVR